MSREARIRAAAAAAVALVIGILLTIGISGAFGTFSAETQNANSAYAGGWVDGPTGFNTPVASGNGAYFTWTAGTHDVLKQEVWFADQGSTANCTGASYTNSLYSGGSALSTSVTSIDGANSGTSSDVPAGNQGDYICYEILSTHNAWYTGTAVGTAVQVGLVPNTFSSNSGATINKHTSFTINFNHPITYSGASTITITVSASTLTIPGIGTVSGSFTPSISCSSGVTPGTSSLVIAVNCGGSTSSTGSGTGNYMAVSGSNVTSTIGPSGHAYQVNQCTSSACQPQITW